LRIDSSAARETVERMGSDKVRSDISRFVCFRYSKKFETKNWQLVVKVASTRDLANALNKYRDQKDMEKHVDGMDYNLLGEDMFSCLELLVSRILPLPKFTKETRRPTLNRMTSAC
jgi:hypothetical protein